MPVDFLTSEQKATYGKFHGEPNEIQSSRYFHLDEFDKALIFQRRGEHNRLGFALQLTSVRFLGSLLSDLGQVPAKTRMLVARQLDISDDCDLESYAQRENTRREHAKVICDHYEYHDFGRPPWRFRLARNLYARAWVCDERPSIMFDFAADWLIQHKVLLPATSTLVRLITEVRQRATNQLWKRLSSLPSNSQKQSLDTLLEVPEGQRASHFDRYRKGPYSISGPSFNKAIDRYTELTAFGIQGLDFSGIPPVRLKTLARYAGTISIKKIARLGADRRYALLLAFVKSFETIALDDAMDVLDLLISDISGKARNIGQKQRLRTLKDLDKSALSLAKVCLLILDQETHDIDLRESIFSMVSPEKLADSVKIVNDLARPANDNFQKEMVEQFGRVCRFMPKLLQEIPLEAATAGAHTLEAFNFLKNITNYRKHFINNAPIGIISKSWEKLIYDSDGRLTKKGYCLCFLDRLQDSLRRRDVYVSGSDRWGDPRSKLLEREKWESGRIQICRSLGRPVNPHHAIGSLISQLDGAYKQVSKNFDNNDSIAIDRSGKHPSITITNLDKLDDPPSLKPLTNRVGKLLPTVDLTELLLEINAHTGFAEEFTHVSESKARAEDLPISICAVLLGEACNIGFEPFVKHQIPALTRHRLSWVKQNYIRAETLVRANARLVDYQSKIPLAKKWGGGEVASADGMRFITPVRTINAGPNRKYFGANRGITWYNFVSDQYSGFHGIAIPGTLRDSIFVLEGLLEQQTSLKPTEIMTDTAGSSDMVFGLFWLLGYHFSPRLADAGEAVFWRIGTDQDYGVLNDVARGVINTDRIVQHWDEMLRIAGSLKLGTIQASELIRTILKSDKPSGLAKAIIEAGRINRTLYLLNYIDDEDYRRRILTQLNRGESRHAVARAICHGQHGEIRKRYREGQEDQLGALGLVTNSVILWNTIYIESALDHLKRNDIEVFDEDEARISPLVYGHINMLGHFSFSLSECIAKGKLRPLST